MYHSDDAVAYEPYPAEINVVIEKAYRDKKPTVSWTEHDGRYEVDFVRMVEEKDGRGGGGGSGIRVKRDSAGLYVSIYSAGNCISARHSHCLL